jgi:hypothetical protein
MARLKMNTASGERKFVEMRAIDKAFGRSLPQCNERRKTGARNLRERGFVYSPLSLHKKYALARAAALSVARAVWAGGNEIAALPFDLPGKLEAGKDGPDLARGDFRQPRKIIDRYRSWPQEPGNSRRDIAGRRPGGHVVRRALGVCAGRSAAGRPRREPASSRARVL